MPSIDAVPPLEAPPVPIADNSMKGKEYNEFSVHQVAAHAFTHAPLKEILIDLAKKPSPFLTVCDLGCAGGANSMLLLDFLLSYLRNTLEDTTREVTIVFEDLPSSDWNELAKTVETHKKSIFKKFDAIPVFLPISFYEKLFPKNSVDLCLSYITLHWLKTPETLPKSGNWVLSAEPDIPTHVFEEWQKAAREDLRLFLKLRAEELKDGCEGLFVVVGRENNEWAQRKLLTKAVLQAAAEGEAGVVGSTWDGFLDRAAVGYFLRTIADVKAAFVHGEADSFDLKNDLELVDVQQCEIGIGEGSPDTKPIAELCWAIHAHSLQATSGATEEQMEAIKKALFELHALEVCPRTGCRVNYIYLRVRRKPRA